jgi:hypothetical protein
LDGDRAARNGEDVLQRQVEFFVAELHDKSATEDTEEKQ